MRSMSPTLLLIAFLIHSTKALTCFNCVGSSLNDTTQTCTDTCQSDSACFFHLTYSINTMAHNVPNPQLYDTPIKVQPKQISPPESPQGSPPGSQIQPPRPEILEVISYGCVSDIQTVGCMGNAQGMDFACFCKTDDCNNPSMNSLARAKRRVANMQPKRNKIKGLHKRQVENSQSELKQQPPFLPPPPQNPAPAPPVEESSENIYAPYLKKRSVPTKRRNTRRHRRHNATETQKPLSNGTKSPSNASSSPAKEEIPSRERKLGSAYMKKKRSVVFPLRRDRRLKRQNDEGDKPLPELNQPPAMLAPQEPQEPVVEQNEGPKRAFPQPILKEGVPLAEREHLNATKGGMTSLTSALSAAVLHDLPADDTNEKEKLGQTELDKEYEEAEDYYSDENLGYYIDDTDDYDKNDPNYKDSNDTEEEPPKLDQRLKNPNQKENNEDSKEIQAETKEPVIDMEEYAMFTAGPSELDMAQPSSLNSTQKPMDNVAKV